jgi:polyferredoxin
MLKKIRTILALVMFIGITLLFVDFTGTAHVWLSWMAKVQFLPAVLALNLLVVVALVVLTLVFGRIYCSVICPLGIFQDAIAWMGKRAKKNRYSY